LPRAFHGHVTTLREPENERTHSVVDFDDADGVLVTFVDAGVLAKFGDPGSASVIRATRVHDLVHHLHTKRQYFTWFNANRFSQLEIKT